MSENKIYIEKSKVLKAVETLRPVRLFYDSELEFKIAMSIFNAVKNRIGHAKSARAVDLAPVVHGHWKNVKRVLNSEWGECSNCDRCHEVTHYCPNCGAKMDESENKK